MDWVVQLWQVENCQNWGGGWVHWPLVMQHNPQLQSFAVCVVLCIAHSTCVYIGYWYSILHKAHWILTWVYWYCIVSLVYTYSIISVEIFEFQSEWNLVVCVDSGWALLYLGLLLLVTDHTQVSRFLTWLVGMPVMNVTFQAIHL